MIQELIKFHNFHWYSPVWLMLFLLCLAVLCLAGRGPGSSAAHRPVDPGTDNSRHRRAAGDGSDPWRHGRRMFLPLVPLAILVAYCPLLMKILVPGFLPSYLEYERLTWLFFEFPLMAYVVVTAAGILRQDAPGRSSGSRGSAARSAELTPPLLILAFLFVCFLFSQPDNRRYFTKPENPYKISQEAVDACDIISRDNDGAKAVVCVQLDHSFVRQDDLNTGSLIYYGIRQYDARYEMCRKIIQPRAYREADFTMDGKIPEGTDYYLAPKVKKISRELRRLDYTKVGETSNYNVFRSPTAAAAQISARAE